MNPKDGTISVTVKNRGTFEITRCEVSGVPVDPRTLPLVISTPDGRPVRIDIKATAAIRVYSPGEAAAEVLPNYPKPGKP